MAQGEGVKQLKDLSQGKLRIAKSINVYILIYTSVLLFTCPPDLVATARSSVLFVHAFTWGKRKGSPTLW